MPVNKAGSGVEAELKVVKRSILCQVSGYKQTMPLDLMTKFEQLKNILKEQDKQAKSLERRNWGPEWRTES